MFYSYSDDLNPFTFVGNDVLELFKAITAHFKIETHNPKLETISRNVDFELGINNDVAQTSSSSAQHAGEKSIPKNIS